MSEFPVEISGGRRCGITSENGLNDGTEADGWWVGYSPRNGLYASVEGPWEDWVTLARRILEEDDRRKGVAPQTTASLGEGK